MCCVIKEGVSLAFFVLNLVPKHKPMSYFHSIYLNTYKTSAIGTLKLAESYLNLPRPHGQIGEISLQAPTAVFFRFGFKRLLFFKHLKKSFSEQTFESMRRLSSAYFEDLQKINFLYGLKKLTATRMWR